MIGSVSPGLGNASGASGQTVSPSTSRGSLLVAMMRTLAQAWRIDSVRSATCLSRCSQLSNTTRRSLCWSTSTRPSSTELPWRRCTSSDVATASTANESSLTPARSHSHTPSPWLGSACSANRSARRVLPTPPGPVNVSSRAVAPSGTSSDSSELRPSSAFTLSGRFPRRGSDAGLARTVRTCRVVSGSTSDGSCRAIRPSSSVSPGVGTRPCSARSLRKRRNAWSASGCRPPRCNASICWDRNASRSGQRATAVPSTSIASG